MDEIDRIVQVAEELQEKPKRWGWKITAVLYGHGKVTVQCVTSKGNSAQLTKKVGVLHGKAITH